MIGARPGIEEFPDADDVAGDAAPMPVGGADNDVEVRVLCEEVVGSLDGFFFAFLSVAIRVSTYFHFPSVGRGGFEFCAD